MSKILVQHSETEPLIEVSNAYELDQVLDDLTSNVSPDSPIIVFVYAHGYQFSLGLGNEKSFVHVELESGEPPYIITVGESNTEGVLAFYLFEKHHTEIARRNLIPIINAREVLNKWIQTETRPTYVEWEEI